MVDVLKLIPRFNTAGTYKFIILRLETAGTLIFNMLWLLTADLPLYTLKRLITADDSLSTCLTVIDSRYALEVKNGIYFLRLIPRFNMAANYKFIFIS